MQHHFTVAVPVDVAWEALLDPERVAPCMPGATLTQSEGNEFAGSVKVKLGPISLLYKGTGTFTETDVEERRVVIEASGKDSRGNGTAAATVTAVLAPAGASTEVQVATDLKVTGKPAQLGRGLISEVGGKILNQFAGCLADRLAGSPSGEEEAASAGTSPAPSPGPSPTGDSTNGSGDGSRVMSVEPGKRRPVAAGASRGDWRVTAPSAAADEAAASASTAEEGPAERADAVVHGTSVPSSEAIDLLGTAGAPVLKRLAPVLALVGLVAVVFLLRRRRSRR